MTSRHDFSCLFKMIVIVSGVSSVSCLMAMGPESPAIPQGASSQGQSPYANRDAVMNNWYKRHGHDNYDPTQPCVDYDGTFIPPEIVSAGTFPAAPSPVVPSIPLPILAASIDTVPQFVLTDVDEEGDPAPPAPVNPTVVINTFMEWHRQHSHLDAEDSLCASLEDSWLSLISLTQSDPQAPLGALILCEVFDDSGSADLIHQLQRAIIGEGGRFESDQQVYCSLLMRRALAYFMIWTRKIEQEWKSQQLTATELQVRKMEIKNLHQPLTQASVQLGLLMSRSGRIRQLQHVVAHENWKGAIEIIADTLGILHQISADESVFLEDNESPIGECQARLEECKRMCVNNLLYILAPLFKYLRERMKVMPAPDSLPLRGANHNETDPGGGTSPGLRGSPVLGVAVSPMKAAI